MSPFSSQRRRRYAVCIAGSIRTMPYAWPSFLNFVEPYVDEIFLNLAGNANCTRTFLGHPKVSSYQIDAHYEAKHGARSIEAQKQHDAREKGCLRLMKASNRAFALVLLTRPDIVYAEAFPFDHLPPLQSVSYIPYGDDHDGVNDQMQAGTLSTLFEQSGWSTPALSSQSPGPERLLGRQIHRLKIHVKRFWYEYALLRWRDASVATAVGLTLFAQHNHNTRIWGRVILNPAFGSIIDANTTCTVTDGHVQLPANVPCIQKRVALTCNRTGLQRAQVSQTVCSDAPFRKNAYAVLCSRNDLRPQMRREMAWNAECADKRPCA